MSGPTGPAEPAGATEPDGPTRERLRRALWPPSRAQAVVAVLLAALGFAAVTQVRSAEVDDSFAGLREQDLIDLLNGLAGTTQRSQSEIERLERAREQLQTTSSKRQAALTQAQGEADTLGILAGVVPVTGPGLTVTIREGDGQVSLESFLDLVQELRASGAEAMQLNDRVRLVAQSSFDVGPEGLLVDGEQLGPPYVLDAIGDPDTLEGALRFPNGPEEELRDDGTEVAAVQQPSLDITAVVPEPDR